MIDVNVRRKLSGLLNMRPSRGATVAESQSAMRAVVRVCQRNSVTRSELVALVHSLGLRMRDEVMPPSRGQTTSTNGAWVKPRTHTGWEYRQCYKPPCHCMRGGAWHGPYRYAKKRSGERKRKVSSVYQGKI